MKTKCVLPCLFLSGLCFTEVIYSQPSIVNPLPNNQKIQDYRYKSVQEPSDTNGSIEVTTESKEQYRQNEGRPAQRGGRDHGDLLQDSDVRSNSIPPNAGDYNVQGQNPSLGEKKSSDQTFEVPQNNPDTTAQQQKNQDVRLLKEETSQSPSTAKRSANLPSSEPMAPSNIPPPKELGYIVPAESFKDTTTLSQYVNPEKDSYEIQMMHRMNDLAREIRRLKDRIAQSDGQKISLAQESLRTAAGNRSVAKIKLRQLSIAEQNRWKDLKPAVEKALQELQGSIDRTKRYLSEISS